MVDSEGAHLKTCQVFVHPVTARINRIDTSVFIYMQTPLLSQRDSATL